MPKQMEQTAERQPVIRYAGLPLPLIRNGRVQKDHLENIGQTRFWLKRELAQQGISHPEEVFLCTIDHRGQLYINRKQKDDI